MICLKVGVQDSLLQTISVGMMRKGSELFLRKCLQYKDETGKMVFELDITCFSEIPNLEVEIEDIFDELKSKKCISKNSEILGKQLKYILLQME